MAPILALEEQPYPFGQESLIVLVVAGLASVCSMIISVVLCGCCKDRSREPECPSLPPPDLPPEPLEPEPESMESVKTALQAESVQEPSPFPPYEPPREAPSPSPEQMMQDANSFNLTSFQVSDSVVVFEIRAIA